MREILKAVLGRSFENEQAMLDHARSVAPEIINAAADFVPCWLVDHEHYLARNLLGLESIMDALARQDLVGYVQLHHDSYKPVALHEAVDYGLAGADYWLLLADIWTMAQAPGWFNDIWLELFTADIEPGARTAMNTDELKVFDSLPEIVTVYRGAKEAAKRGLSWSLDINTAQFFAERTNGSVWRADIPRGAVLAYFAGRDEREVVVNLPLDVDVRSF